MGLLAVIGLQLHGRPILHHMLLAPKKQMGEDWRPYGACHSVSCSVGCDLREVEMCALDWFVVLPPVSTLTCWCQGPPQAEAVLLGGGEQAVDMAHRQICYCLYRLQLFQHPANIS